MTKFGLGKHFVSLKFFYLQLAFLFTIINFPLKAYCEKQSIPLKAKENSLKVCTTGGFVPFSSYANGAWIGFDIEMIKEFSKTSHFKYKVLILTPI